MLDNLVNPNLSGLSGRIIYNSSDAYIAQIIPAIFAFTLLIIFLLMLNKAISPTKTQSYRKQLVDLYVAGLVRKLAKEDGIDLDEEMKILIKRKKKKDLEHKSLDEVLEIEKAEKIIDEQEKALKK